MVAQIRVESKTNEHKAALERLGVLPLAATVVTGYATFCQKDVCRAVTKGGGDYLFTVKDNQPTLHHDIACMFGESAAFSPHQQSRWASEQDAATTTNKGHGRVETRTPALSKYLSAWPGIAQVFQLHRVRRFSDGRVEEETSYGITSLRPLDAGASRLLCLNRTHGSIENNLHWVRDVIFGEDASHIRSGNSPQILAATRNALTHLLTAAKLPNFAAALRRFAIRPLEALRIVNAGTRLTENYSRRPLVCHKSSLRNSDQGWRMRASRLGIRESNDASHLFVPCGGRRSDRV